MLNYEIYARQQIQPRCTLKSPERETKPSSKRTITNCQKCLAAIYSQKTSEPRKKQIILAENNKKERITCLPSVKVNLNKCGSSINFFISFSLGYSVFPPSELQKLSGSLPSLTDMGCHAGCEWHHQNRESIIIKWVRPTNQQWGIPI